MTKVKEKGFC